jgi:WD40 repeat protein
MKSVTSLLPQKLFCFFVFSLLHFTTIAQDLKMVLPIGHTDKIYTARFSPDGKRIITTSKDKTAKIWDISNGYLVADLKGHPDPVLDAQYSPDGKKLLTYSNDFYEPDINSGLLKIWDAQQGTFITNIDATFTYWYFFLFSPDSKSILTGTGSDTIKMWDATTGKLISTLPLIFRGNIKAGFSPDSRWIVCINEANTITVFEASTGRLAGKLKGHTAAPQITKFNQKGDKLLSISHNESIVWQVQGWKQEKKIPGMLTGSSMLLTPDEKRIVTSDEANKTVSIWDAATRKKIGWSIKGKRIYYQNELNCTEDNVLNGDYFSASSQRLAAVINTACLKDVQLLGRSITSNDKTALLWDIKTGKLVDSLKGHTSSIGFLQFSPNGSTIVTVSDDGTAKVWDANSGVLLSDLRGHTFNSRAGSYLPSVEFSTNDKKLFTVSDNGMGTFWNTETGKVAGTLKSPFKNLFSVSISAEGKKILAGAQDGSAIIWDASTQLHQYLKKTSDVGIDPTSEIDLDEVTRLVPPEISADGSKALLAIQSQRVKIFDIAGRKIIFDQVNNNYPKVAYSHFSPDGTKFIVGYSYYDHEPSKRDTNSTVFDFKSKKPLYKIEATDAFFSPDNQKLVANTGRGFAICDASTGKLLYALRMGGTTYSVKALYSPDVKQIFTFDWWDSAAIFWNATTGDVMHALQQKRAYRDARYSLDGKKITTYSDDGGLETWDAENGALLNQLVGHTEKINYFQYSPDGRHIVSSAMDNTSVLWDAESGKLLYSFFALDSADYFVQLPSGYYQSTPNASKLLHYVTKDLKVISFEQLDVKYNRPDLVLEAMGNTDTAAIRTYRNAYYKRIKKLGIDTSSFREGYSVPEADFANRDDISNKQTTGNLSLHIKGRDSTYQIDRYNVWVNEVPVYGQRGISIRDDNTKMLDKTIEISLSDGVNRIETSITNVNGTESYRMPLIVNYTPAVKQKETTYFIGIGIDKFANASKNLQYSAKDIRDLCAAMQKKFGNSIVIDTLLNENVTVENIIALKKTLLQTNINDKVIISYSGHGLLSKSFDYYLSTYAVNFDNPEENGLPYDELENLLDSIPARKKLLLIDACHSGEVDKEDAVAINAAADSLHLTRGTTIVGSKEGRRLGLKNSFELMQNLFVNVGKSTGATIISAAAGTQFALEKNDLQNGVFTYCVLEAMKTQASMKVSALKNTVTTNVQKLTNGLQKPTSRNESINVDWLVW